MPDTFRVTNYVFDSTSSPFSGTQYTLTLDQDLETDYFLLITGSAGDDTSTGDVPPSGNFVRVIQDPHGNFSAGTSNSNQIILERAASATAWQGVVTVVECLGDKDNGGFKLLDVIEHDMAANDNSDTATSGTAWGDINQVVPFAGWRGGGIYSTSSTDVDNGHSAARFYPSSTATINIERDVNEDDNAVSYVIYVVEWGSEWTVQRATITGTAGGIPVDATSEYDTGSITSVVRDNTWLWACGHATDDGIGDCWFASIWTLGDGVNQNANENTVAVGSRYNDSRTTDIYTLTHADAAVDYRNASDEATSVLTVDATVDSLTDAGTYDASSTRPDHSGSTAFALVSNSCNGTGAAFPRPFAHAFHTDDTSVLVHRTRTGVGFDWWLQSIDLAGITFTSSTEETRTFSLDAFLKLFNVTRTFSLDASIKGSISKTFSLDATLSSGGESTDYVLAYDMEEGSGTTLANTGSAGTGSQYDLDFVNTPVWVTGPGSSSPQTQAVQFIEADADGAEENVDNGDPLSGEECTISVLCKIKNEVNTAYLFLLGRPDNGIWFSPWSDGKMYAGYQIGGTAYDAVSGTNFENTKNDGEYHRWTLTIKKTGNDKTVRLLLDGTEIASQTYTNAPDFTNDGRVGLNRDPGGTSNRTLESDVAAIRVYDRVLTDNEEANLFLQGTSSPTKSFNIDSIFQAEFNRQFSLDSFILLSPTKLFSLDATLIGPGTRQFTLDKILKGTLSIPFSVDFISTLNPTKPFSLDTILFGSISKEFYLDSRLIGFESREFTVEAKVAFIRTLTTQLDTRLVERYTRLFSLDVNLTKSFRQFDIDCYLTFDIQPDFILYDPRLTMEVERPDITWVMGQPRT